MSPSLPRPMADMFKFIEKMQQPFDQAALQAKLDALDFYLDSLERQWFKRPAAYSDDHIGENLFARPTINRRTAKPYVKLNLFALRSSLGRLPGILARNLRGSGSRQVGTFLSDYMMCVPDFLRSAHIIATGDDPGWVHSRTTVIHSNEAFDASSALFLALLDNRLPTGPVAHATSAFLLRQAIELRLWHALGVLYVTVDNVGLVKVSPERILNFVVHHPKIKLPVSGPILVKVHRWTNLAIHGGISPYPWQTEWALHLIAPLFKWKKHGSTTSRYGAIEIDGTWFRHSREGELVDLVCQTSKRIVRDDVRIEKLSHPEAYVA